MRDPVLREPTRALAVYKLYAYPHGVVKSTDDRNNMWLAEEEE